MMNTRKKSWYKQKSKYIRFKGGYEQHIQIVNKFSYRFIYRFGWIQILKIEQNITKNDINSTKVKRLTLVWIISVFVNFSDFPFNPMILCLNCFLLNALSQAQTYINF